MKFCILQKLSGKVGNGGSVLTIPKYSTGPSSPPVNWLVLAQGILPSSRFFIIWLGYDGQFFAPPYGVLELLAIRSLEKCEAFFQRRIGGLGFNGRMNVTRRKN